MIIVIGKDKELRKLETQENILFKEVVIEGITYYYPISKAEFSDKVKESITDYPDAVLYFEEPIILMERIYISNKFTWEKYGYIRWFCDLETGKKYEAHEHDGRLEIKEFADKIYILDKDADGKIIRYYDCDKKKWQTVYEDESLEFFYFEEKPYIRKIVDKEVRYIYDINNDKEYSCFNNLEFYKYDDKLYLLEKVEDGRIKFIYDMETKKVYGNEYYYCEFYKYENDTYIVVKKENETIEIYDLKYNRAYKTQWNRDRKLEFYMFEKEVFFIEVDEKGLKHSIHSHSMGTLKNLPIYYDLQPEFRTFEGSIYIQYVDKTGKIKHICDYKRSSDYIDWNIFKNDLELISFEGKIYVLDRDENGKTISIYDPDTREWYNAYKGYFLELRKVKDQIQIVEKKEQGEEIKYYYEFQNNKWIKVTKNC